MHVALGIVGAAVTEQFSDHRRVFLLDRGMAGESMPQIMQPQRLDFRLWQDNFVPIFQERGLWIGAETGPRLFARKATGTLDIIS